MTLSSAIRMSTWFFLMGLSGNLIASDLVSPKWLNQQMREADLVVLDLRRNEDYLSGHIPGALNIPFPNLTREKDGIAGFVETPRRVQKLLRQSGVTNNDLIVLYSDWSFIESMRAYWILDFYGHPQLKVLDGGIQAWKSDFPGHLEDTQKVVQSSEYVIRIRPEVITTKLATMAAIQGDHSIIIDARDPEHYAGRESLTDRKGHIPKSINMPWYEFVQNRDAEDSFERLTDPTPFEESETLLEWLRQLPSDKKIVLYCNGGQESAVVYFALKSLGIESAVYDGSWFEWSADSKLPVELE